MVHQPFLLVAVILLGVLTLSGCGTPAESAPAQTVPHGDSSQGAAAIRYYGCGSCHTIPGINGANANVGPPLNRIGTREYIAGKLQNNPNNLMYWIMKPQKVWPGVDMPDMHVTHRDARNIAAYLYTLR
jgi:cytochrome c2